MPTPDDVAAFRAIAFAEVIAQTICELGEVPEGHLFAHLQGRVSLGEFQAFMRLLERAKLIKIENHLITWIGPNDTQKAEGDTANQ